MTTNLQLSLTECQYLSLHGNEIALIECGDVHVLLEGIFTGHGEDALNMLHYLLCDGWELNTAVARVAKEHGGVF